MRNLTRFLRALPFLILCLPAALAAMAVLAAADLAWLIFGRRRLRPDAAADRRSATAVIPNWNGRDLLERYLPSVIEAMRGNAANEIIVVDNGSTDGSAEFVRERFPSVRVLALRENLGFGGGSNAGFRDAKNDIVVLLNTDMRVAQDFLDPLLEGFADERVFAVGCQIFFGDPAKRREETGLTQARWRDGALRVRHRTDAAITDLYPCFYGGGGSCAFDRRKFLELGGFDELLKPFYLEDTDLGYMAWKRGWQVLYQPRSVVWHEHRGTIGKHFTPEFIQAVYKKNFALFSWKNIHDWRRLGPHFFFSVADAVVSAFAGDSPERANGRGLCRAFLQLPRAVASRWRARSLASVGDTEALRRPMGGYFRDRFGPPRTLGPASRLRLLFVSPYPVYPPVHGGGVFMYHTLRELARECEVHLAAMLDCARDLEPQQAIAPLFASTEFLVRLGGTSPSFGSVKPHAVHEFWHEDFEWILHRQIYTQGIDVVQLEYTPMAQYAGRYGRVACVLFEHDVYFQSIARGLRDLHSLTWKLEAALEYLRALRYELRMLPRMDSVQVCSRENRDYLLGFLPRLEGRIQDGLRAGIDTARYEFRPRGREPLTMLFVGSFRHFPNQAGLTWFVQKALPRIVERSPEARLVIVGSGPPPRHVLPASSNIELRGSVEDIREPLSRYSVFVCPVLSGSGVRVKLIEAFAAGIPAVSTRLGAEGLAREDGEFCALADEPAAFADRALELLKAPDRAIEMAVRARREVENNWDSAVITRRLVESYREILREKRGEPQPAPAATCSSDPASAAR